MTRTPDMNLAQFEAHLLACRAAEPAKNTLMARTDEEWNALIAAAPEMLAVLKMALESLGNMTTDQFSCGEDRPIRDAMEAAIARAEGRE